ncbi:MAG TPA: carboxypeptidase-like regulatory domain-containing protein [Alphaproteobacteria bacterium]|jgi:hypothetical protein|nr:carboxypeptidase-like regulatory domain-containing protein [Alphaproteobacteria bacterium]
MTIRLVGALLCGAMLFVTTSAFAGEPIPGVDVNLGKNPGGAIVVSGKTDAKGVFAAPMGISPGSYLLTIGRIPASAASNRASITITVPAQQNVTFVNNRGVIDQQGSEQVIITTPIATGALTYKFTAGGTYFPRGFMVTIQTADSIAAGGLQQQ